MQRRAAAGGRRATPGGAGGGAATNRMATPDAKLRGMLGANSIRVATMGADKLAASGWGQPKAPSVSGPPAAVAGKASSAGGAMDSARSGSRSGALAGSSQKSLAKAAKPGKINLEDHINLEVMLKLKETFMQADVDGGGDLDIDEFVDAFDGILGDGDSEEELRKLFMRIDANSDGTVDWDEFSSFILLENQGAANLRESESVLQFHHSRMPDRVSQPRSAPRCPRPSSRRRLTPALPGIPPPPSLILPSPRRYTRTRRTATP